MNNEPTINGSDLPEGVEHVTDKNDIVQVDTKQQKQKIIKALQRINLEKINSEEILYVGNRILNILSVNIGEDKGSMSIDNPYKSNEQAEIKFMLEEELTEARDMINSFLDFIEELDLGKEYDKNQVIEFACGLLGHSEIIVEMQAALKIKEIEQI